MQQEQVYLSPDVAAVRRLHNHILAQKSIYFKLRDQLFMLSENLHQAHRRGDPDTAVELKNHHPDLIGKDWDHIRSHQLTLEEARLVIAKEHGFVDWKEAMESGNKAFEANFEKAIDALLSGDILLLEKLLDAQPQLLETRSEYGHGATLLHYCAANGVEIYRQTVPANLIEGVRLLLEKGANVETVSFCYGGLYTVRALLESGSHHEAAGNLQSLLDLLSEYGA